VVLWAEEAAGRGAQDRSGAREGGGQNPGVAETKRGKSRVKESKKSHQKVAKELR
jgi:hypothetical protein